jgi:glycosyltransferase involved in cell wall biosynthesis
LGATTQSTQRESSLPNNDARDSRVLVSVIIAAYNDATRLPRSVASVQAQSFTDWELIIANDGSTDHTLTVAQHLASRDSRIRVLDLPHGGAARARNAAAEAARGTWLAIQDCDDYSLPTRLQRQIEALETEPTVGVVAAYVNRVAADGRVHGIAQMGPTSLEAFRRRRADRPVYVINGTAMIRRDLFIASGGYPEDYRVGEDLALFNLRLAPRADILVIPEPLVCVEMHEDSLSRRYADEIVEADDVVRLNLKRHSDGLPEADYRTALGYLRQRPSLVVAEHRRRQQRHAWFAQATARLSAGSVAGVPPLLLAFAIAPWWTTQRLFSRVFSYAR